MINIFIKRTSISKFKRKQLCHSCGSISCNFTKKDSDTGIFLTNFPRDLRYKTLFYTTPLGNCFCSTKKYFTTKIVIVKSPLVEEKKLETACKKKQLLTLDLHIKISLLLFSLPSQVFRNSVIVLRRFIHYRK